MAQATAIPITDSPRSAISQTNPINKIASTHAALTGAVMLARSPELTGFRAGAFEIEAMRDHIAALHSVYVDHVDALLRELNSMLGEYYVAREDFIGGINDRMADLEADMDQQAEHLREEG